MVSKNIRIVDYSLTSLLKRNSKNCIKIWLICWMICFTMFILSVKMLFPYWLWQCVVSILALTMDNTVYQISTKAHGGCDWSAEDAYFSMAPDHTFAFVMGPYTWFCICHLDYDYVLHIVNLAILYQVHVSCSILSFNTGEHCKLVPRCICWNMLKSSLKTLYISNMFRLEGLKDFSQ
jgi:ABC-type multidrug transport system fused ATPase/permease subunit